MTTKYTKGPWKIHRDYYGKVTIGPSWLDVVADINQYDENSAGNANLILCAPDLLKIAIAAMSYIGSIPCCAEFEYTGEKIDKEWAENVISIATSNNS